MLLTTEDRILIAGSQGMVGSAMTRQLKKEGFFNLLLPAKEEINFINQEKVHLYLKNQKPSVIVIAAAKVGGIYANVTYPADFLYENLMIASHLIHEAHRLNISRILYLGSSCIYPKFANQPIVEEALLTGPLEPTNEAYAIAKIAGLRLISSYAQQYGRKYIAAMPTNLYGPNDNYHSENSHVIPALIRRFHEAKCAKAQEVTIWGSGKSLREFLFVDDLAEALVLLLKQYEGLSHINVGSDCEISISALAEIVSDVIGFKGKIIHDLTKPEGIFRKKTDSTKIKAMGWRPKMSLKEGIAIAYQDYLNRFTHV
jgi:GDP-L-fucose synthase